MRCLLYYSESAGRGLKNKINGLADKLRAKFEFVDIYRSESKEEGCRYLLDFASSYDVLVVCGGDGTFNNAANALMKLDNPPIIGYINSGTLGDVGKNFGVKRSINKAVSIILRGKTKDIDICRFNDKYFVYMSAVGSYSDISYVASHKPKRLFRRFHYYFLGIARMFKRSGVSYKIQIDNSSIEGDSPFVLAANGKCVGGFKINKNSSISDGKFEIILPNKGLTNGIMSTFLGHKCKILRCSKAIISINNGHNWCLDGEKAQSEVAEISISDKKLRVFCH